MNMVVGDLVGTETENQQQTVFDWDNFRSLLTVPHLNVTGTMTSITDMATVPLPRLKIAFSRQT